MTDLVTARESLGLTQKELAARLEVSVRWLKYREAGTRPTPAWLNLALAELRRQAKKGGTRGKPD